MTAKCKIKSCNTKSRQRGWCPKHYTRWKRHGDPRKTKNNMVPITWKYLLSCSVTNEETGCIEWQKGKSEGYGVATHNKFTDRTHRISYRLHHGKINGVYVLHTCDNKLCINPDHLFLGTHADNMKDKVMKDRQARGTDFPISKFNEADILKIRAMAESNLITAKIFGVDPSTISYIRIRKTWRHVT